MRAHSCLVQVFGTLLALTAPACAYAGPINVNINGLRNDVGVIRCGLFASADGFRVPGRELREVVSNINAGKAHCAFNSVPDGSYAIAVFHAQNNEKTLETGLFGQPKQGVGFSRNPSITFGPPSFSSASFPVNAKPVNIQIEMKY
ncbi:DUF2141 domain-containing protein [Microvirga alba]|uniref:DUF2141 domain-containing protein n=1 Tax=Microvirga alba TaxID=2791025 RepID=A0A931FN42_9HYPH|nr:DUF2141 domain-containing protein [Microvirga alba]MBF9233270.1 DUF2141 domain-containing protein [Microvirga alba]